MREETGKGAFPFILHCFSSGAELARVGVELGGYVSFSGILTFKNSPEIREIASNVPRDRLLVETDAPYLAPVPHRGKRNEPSFVRHTAAVLAETIGVSEDEIGEITTDNVFRLFTKMPRPAGPSMPDRLRFTILGCGSSPGVPRINGDWGKCDPDNPKNRRRRASMLVERIARDMAV